MIDDPNDLNELRAYILRYFMLDGARQSGDLLRQPEMRRYDRYLLQRMIRAMALAGLLDRWGRTRGAWFMTSRLGFVVLVTLQNEYFGHNPRRLP